MEIEAFRAQEYWTRQGAARHARAARTFEARLVSLDGSKLDKFDLANADRRRARRRRRSRPAT